MPGVSGEDVLKGAADGHLMVDVELAHLAENGVVVLEEFVAGLDGESLHGFCGNYPARTTLP